MGEKWDAEKVGKVFTVEPTGEADINLISLILVE